MAASTVTMGCGVLHGGDEPVQADGAQTVQALGTRPCQPTPTGVAGHHDLKAGGLLVRVHETAPAAPASLQIACTEAAAAVLVNWQRNRCADYAVASAQGALVGEQQVEAGCRSAVCEVSQRCEVTLLHIPDFTFDAH